MQTRDFREPEQEKAVRRRRSGLDGRPASHILLTGQLVTASGSRHARPTIPILAAPPRWQRRPEARPDEILDAALTVFGESGFARAKIDDVARLAGVSKGTVYLYFDSKESLFREMVRAKVVASLAEGEALVRTYEGSARALLVELIRRMYGRMRARADDADRPGGPG